MSRHFSKIGYLVAGVVAVQNGGCLESQFDSVLANMERTFHDFASRVPPPQKVELFDNTVYRYVEQTVLQAIVQKLARVVTGLKAVRLLMEAGLHQEQGAVQRVLDDLDEDVAFLCSSILHEHTALHDRYLKSFYEEEFDAPTALESTQKRDQIKRDAIRAHVGRAYGLDASDAVNKAGRTVFKAYSGYVHAASPHIMDMYGGNPPKFHIGSMRHTSRHLRHRLDIQNYFYRGVASFSIAALAFGDRELFEEIRSYSEELLQLMD